MFLDAANTDWGGPSRGSRLRFRSTRTSDPTRRFVSTPTTGMSATTRRLVFLAGLRGSFPVRPRGVSGRTHGEGPSCPLCGRTARSGAASHPIKTEKKSERNTMGPSPLVPTERKEPSEGHLSLQSGSPFPEF